MNSSGTRTSLAHRPWQLEVKCAKVTNITLHRNVWTMKLTKGDKTIYSTVDDQVVCSSRGSITSALAPCSHEEADSMIFVHIQNMAQQGYTKVMIRTVDTGVVVIAVAKFLQIGLKELWVAFGSSKNYRHIEVHQIVSGIGAEKSQALAFFHAFTGCDTVSFFSNRGKKSAWQA